MAVKSPVKQTGKDFSGIIFLKDNTLIVAGKNFVGRGPERFILRRPRQVVDGSKEPPYLEKIAPDEWRKLIDGQYLSSLSVEQLEAIAADPDLELPRWDVDGSLIEDDSGARMADRMEIL